MSSRVYVIHMLLHILYCTHSVLQKTVFIVTKLAATCIYALHTYTRHASDETTPWSTNSVNPKKKRITEDLFHTYFFAELFLLNLLRTE